jgi:hypothetical protein
VLGCVNEIATCVEALAEENPKDKELSTKHDDSEA